ncbi:MAG: metal ABC transporter permease [Acidobacteriota bacterium]|nr:metal ABC transporter permease [Acidobacteriota bacterium]MDH3784429.1 metal ABC transporter permease [Acidobacteriota bacterium]
MFELGFSARNVLIGASLLGVAGGLLGSFALLRRQSLLGDALAHAALPGVCLAFLLTGSKSPGVLLAGALVAGLLGALIILAIVRNSRIKEDTSIGIVLSVFFGGGIVLLTVIQKMPMGNQTGLDKYLFGQAATLMPRDLRVMGVLVAIVLVLTWLFYKEFKLLCFDREFQASLGTPVRWLEILMTTLLVTVVVIGLQTVGVVLVVATLITPAAAARQWTERLGVMLFLAVVIGGGSGALGALWSASAASMPTGPVIVLCSSGALVLSILFGRSRGILWSSLRARTVAQRIRRENLLKDLYRWGESPGEDWTSEVSINLLTGMRGQGASRLLRVARALRRRGLLERTNAGMRLTPDGLLQAESIVRKHRLWETYLTRKLDLASDHVHRDADLMEHALDEEAVALLDERLGYPGIDPHGQPIPPRRAA